MQLTSSSSSSMYDKPFGSINLTTQNHFEPYSTQRQLNDTNHSQDTHVASFENPHNFAFNLNGTHSQIDQYSLSTNHHSHIFTPMSPMQSNTNHANANVNITDNNNSNNNIDNDNTNNTNAIITTSNSNANNNNNINNSNTTQINMDNGSSSGMLTQPQSSSSRNFFQFLRKQKQKFKNSLKEK